MVYRHINQHVNSILPRLNQSVPRYLNLLALFTTVDVSQHVRFQTEYRKFWAMNVARLGKAWFADYFQLMQDSKTNAQVTLSYVVNTLHASHGKLQFSFATKLVHMQHPHLPIYDTRVREFYFMPAPDDGWPCPAKLAHLTVQYDFLASECQRVIRQNLLQPAINQFRLRFHPPQTLSTEKIVDFLIWEFVKWLQDGAFVSGAMAYS